MTSAPILPPQWPAAVEVRLPVVARLPRPLGADEVAAIEARLELTERSRRVTARPLQRSTGSTATDVRGRGAR